MATLAELADRFALTERPAGNLLDAAGVLAQAIAAANFYAGYAQIISRIPDPLVIPAAAIPSIADTTEISESEWALIRSLFMLYVERETALQLEASRGLGMDVYGRASSEVAADIMQMELELPHQAFVGLIVTV
ncbi:MAG: hypothetical protein COW02_03460 [Comamonadaceae bacterium CG12_big_fil_rev_8_21_14_0_65_59_15]|nr:MAG: hypothetical protein COW02_03460 [Comamonadaceae bacterium CG12_big_fil_rev_8_21_14_0_65_59_15]